MSTTYKYIIIFIFIIYFNLFFILLEEPTSYEHSWYPTRGYYLDLDSFNNYCAKNLKLGWLDFNKIYKFECLEDVLTNLEKRNIDILDFVSSINYFQIAYVLETKSPLCSSNIEVFEIIKTKKYGIIIFKSNPEPYLLKITDCLVYSNKIIFSKKNYWHIDCRFDEVDTYFMNLYRIYTNAA